MDLGPNFSVAPDNYPAGLRLVCWNSVDGSAALKVRLGWFRFVCANGMSPGLTLGSARRAHTANADIGSAFESLTAQMEAAQGDRDTMVKWAKTGVALDRLRHWVDGPLAERWNTLSAARVWHICCEGRDAVFVPPFQKAAPSRRQVRLLGAVPGSQVPAGSFYAVAQALSWVASRRADAEEGQIAQGQIAGLLEALQN